MMANFQVSGLPSSTPDQRTLEDFELELRRYVENTEIWAQQAWITDAWDSLEESVLEVVNLTDTYLMGVRVQLTFDNPEIHCIDERPEVPSAPDTPRAFGEPLQSPGWISGIDTLVPRLGHSPPPVPLSPNLRIADSRTITFDVGSLPPRETAVSDPFRLVLSEEMAGALVSAIGIATAEGHHRVVNVRLDAAVA